MNRHTAVAIPLLILASFGARSTAHAAEATTDTLAQSGQTPVPAADTIYTSDSTEVAPVDSTSSIGLGVLKADPMDNTKEWAKLAGLPKPEEWGNQMDAMMLIDYMTSVATGKAMNYVAPRYLANLEAWNTGITFREFARHVGFEDPNSSTVWQVLQVALGLPAQASKNDIVFHPSVAGTSGQCPYNTKPETK